MSSVWTGAAIVTAGLDGYAGIRYCIKVIRRQSAPRLSTWLIFEAGVLMTLAAYWSSGTHSLLKAALNTADAVLVTMILLVILAIEKKQYLRLTANEKTCLILSCVAAAAWALSRTAWVGVVGFQMLMVVAYFPTLESLWKWKPGPSPEPWETWTMNGAVGLIGVVTDFAPPRDLVAMIYPLRAFVLCSLVVALVLRWRHKNFGFHRRQLS
jgi:hypothetical protein